MRIHEMVSQHYSTFAALYERWGAGTGALHFGFFDNPVDFHEIEPEQRPAAHLQSHVRMFEVITDFINPSEGSVVVDAGCGVGSMFPYLTARGVHVIGVNITPEHLHKAQSMSTTNMLPYISLVFADYKTFPLEHDSVDTVLMVESFFHAPDKRIVLHEAKRILKPGGSMVIVDVMVNRNRKDLSKEQITRVQEIDNGMQGAINTDDEFETAVRDVGFGSIEYRDITPNVLPSMQRAAGSALALRYDQDAPETLDWHRRAIVAIRDLAQQDIMRYALIRITKGHR